MRLIPELSPEQRIAFVAAARGFSGAAWAHQGRRAHRMDCLGLAVLSFLAIGVALRDRTDYGLRPHNRKLSAEMREHFGVPVQDLQLADIVTLRWTGEEHHVAIVTDHPHGIGLIHCWRNSPGAPAGGGRVVEHGIDAAWRGRIVEIFRP